MIDGDVAIQIIESRLTNLIRQGQLNAKYNKSSKSISFYLRDIEVNSLPLLTLRLSNHRPDFQGYIKNDFMLPSNTKNISIEFFKPRRNSLGKRVKDEMNANINAETFKNITPFAITSHKYSPSTLEWADFEKIYQAILTYLKTMTYNDPLAGISKSANTKTKIATSKKSMYAVPQNISYRNGKYPEAATILTYGADAVPESINRNNTKNNNNMNKNRIRLTESQLHRVIKESVKRVLREADDIDDVDAFYRVQLCYDEGGEAGMPEDFPTYHEALQYLQTIKPKIGERVEIYLMREDGDRVDFVDQLY